MQHQLKLLSNWFVRLCFVMSNILLKIKFMTYFPHTQIITSRWHCRISDLVCCVLSHSFHKICDKYSSPLCLFDGKCLAPTPSCRLVWVSAQHQAQGQFAVMKVWTQGKPGRPRWPTSAQSVPDGQTVLKHIWQGVVTVLLYVRDTTASGGSHPCIKHGYLIFHSLTFFHTLLILWL